MRAAVIEAFAGPIRIAEVPDPTPPRNGVVLRVEANGVCRSDWHGWMGHDPDIVLPHVPGHEMAGVVEATGPDVTRWRVGDRVTVPFVVGCGACPSCRDDHPNLCDENYQPGFTAWGSFASFVALPHADLNLVALPETLGFVEAASLGCRFATAYRAVVTQGDVSAGETVAVHGCGGVGLSAIMIAHALGARVIGIDIAGEALTLARSLGADAVVNATGSVDPAEAVRELSGGGAHVSIDALGSTVTCRSSVASLRKRGRHVQVGLMLAGDRNASVPMDLVVDRELRLVGSKGLPAHAYVDLLEMIGAGVLAPGRLVQRTVDLGEGVRTLEKMDDFDHRGVVVIDSF